MHSLLRSQRIPLLSRGRPGLSLARSATQKLRLDTLRSQPRGISSTSTMSDPFRPAKRVAGQKQDVWYCFLLPLFDVLR